MCGEQSVARPTTRRSAGSSSRVRGTGKKVLSRDSSTGIIPACAGNRAILIATIAAERDHPRVCGEQKNLQIFQNSLMGSSPRVRGTARRAQRDLANNGIIPACAGNRCNRTDCKLFSRDHPRVCGEQRQAWYFGRLRRGSSPRVRGTVPCTTPTTTSLGIIPACAGNSRCTQGRRRRRWDHPRVCGEQAYKPLFIQLALGSSPRVRGTGRNIISGKGVNGIIPACAGNSHTPLDIRPYIRDHPRVCGEQLNRHF